MYIVLTFDSLFIVHMFSIKIIKEYSISF
jgi:hypothetical protein